MLTSRRRQRARPRRRLWPQIDHAAVFGCQLDASFFGREVDRAAVFGREVDAGFFGRELDYAAVFGREVNHAAVFGRELALDGGDADMRMASWLTATPERQSAQRRTSWTVHS